MVRLKLLRSFGSKRLFCSEPAKLSVNFSPLKLNYDVTGDLENSTAPPLVILHGLFGNLLTWNSMSKALHQKLQSPVSFELVF